MPTSRPPDVPSGVDPQVAQYLRRLATWAYQEIDAKIGKTDPVQQVLLYPITQKTPQAVFGLIVNESGVMATQRVGFGSGQP